MWTAITSIVQGVLSSLVGPLMEAWRSWREQRTARSLGRAEQGRADAEAGLQEARKANAARTGGRSDAELDDLLRGDDPRTRR